MRHRLRVLALLLVLAGCMPMPHGELEELFPREPRPQAFSVTAGGRTLAGVRSRSAGGPPILFLHGSPGEWQHWAHFLDHPRLQAYGPLIAPDRPGFGGSRAGGAMPSLQQQAHVLAGLLEGLPPAIVVGHSLGGAIAARIAFDEPARVRGLLLIAASVAPELEQPRWYNELLTYRLARALLPRSIVTSNDELYGLPAELRALEPAWSRLRVPVTVVQGLRDQLVYPATADYLERRLRGPHRIERIPDQGHFVLWEQPERIVDQLAELIAASEPGRIPELQLPDVKERR